MALSPSAQSAVEALLKQNIDRVFPACTVVAMLRGETVFEGAWGHIDPETRQFPTQMDTLFDIASVTKLFVATAFLSLVSEGRVKLETPLVEVIPEFGAVSPRQIVEGYDPINLVPIPTPEHLVGKTADPAQVTFFHLLTHTSGLPAWREVYKAIGAPPTPPNVSDPLSSDERWANAVKIICGYDFVGTVGDTIRYSDLGLMLLGEAVMRLTGLPLENAVRARVLEPLGLSQVVYNPVRKGIAQELIAPTEIDATWRQRRTWGEVHDENAGGAGGVSGHAGLFADVASIAALGNAWLYEPERLGINAELASAAKSEQFVTGELRRGLGFALKAHVGAAAGDKMGVNTFGHTGFTGTSLWVDPQSELIIACLTNRVYYGREQEGIYEFRRALHDLLADELI